MSSLTQYFENHFNTQREEWERALLAELKLPAIEKRDRRELTQGPSWQTLGLERRAQVQLAPHTTWKKAATTYAFLPEGQIEALISQDLKSGVRDFFFLEGSLTEKKWSLVERELLKDLHTSDLEVFFLGVPFKSEKLRTTAAILSGKESQRSGGSSVQELGELAAAFSRTGNPTATLGIYVDSHFFQSIAKLRAARLLAMKISEEQRQTFSGRIVALTSFTGWTLFERYSNMLRNLTAVAAGYIGGADHVQSTGYNVLLELETESMDFGDHFERSQRMARNTAHILGLESMLGVVHDAGFGSFHIENVTQELCEKSWALMQRILKGEDFSNEIKLVRQEKLINLRTRKTIVSGINDFPDATEELRVTLKPEVQFRAVRPFEELRLRVEKLQKPEVFIALFGDYGTLNARLNFIKNYFELLGLKVLDPGQSVTDVKTFKDILALRKEAIIAVCAADTDYEQLGDSLAEVKSPYRFVAGKKFSPAGFVNIFAGQDVFEVLENLVKNLEGGKQ